MRVLVISVLMMVACGDTGQISIQETDTDVLDMAQPDVATDGILDVSEDIDTPEDMGMSGQIRAAEVPPRPPLPRASII